MSDLDDGPLYYAKVDQVMKRPVRTKSADGSTTISLGFPVCTMTDWAGEEAASIVAELMNAGHAALLKLEQQS